MKNSRMKKLIGIILLLVGGFILNDIIELAIRYFKERLVIRDLVEKNLKKRSSRTTSTDTERGIERKMEFIEAMLMKNGAQPVFTSSEELYKLRRTFFFNEVYYRLSVSEIEGETFIIINAADSDDYADVGLMEEIGAISPGLSEEEMEQEIKDLLEI